MGDYAFYGNPNEKKYVECEFCREYCIPKKATRDYLNAKYKKRIKKYRKKIKKLREMLLYNHLIIAQEEYGYEENVHWNGKTFF